MADQQNVNISNKYFAK